MLSTSHYLCEVRFVLPFIFCTLIFSVFSQRQQGLITDNYDEISDNTPITPVPDIIQADSIITSKTKESKFDNWDFATYEYWPVLGAYNDIRWAEELQSRLTTNIGITTTIKSIPGVSKYYVTLGQANSVSEAKEIQKILDIPRVNQELNGSLWWKKINI